MDITHLFISIWMLLLGVLLILTYCYGDTNFIFKIIIKFTSSFEIFNVEGFGVKQRILLGGILAISLGIVALLDTFGFKLL